MKRYRVLLALTLLTLLLPPGTPITAQVDPAPDCPDLAGLRVWRSALADLIRAELVGGLAGVTFDGLDGTPLAAASLGGASAPLGYALDEAGQIVQVARAPEADQLLADLFRCQSPDADTDHAARLESLLIAVAALSQGSFDPAVLAAGSPVLDNTSADEMLAIRASSPLFNLTTPEEVRARVRIFNTGPDQIPGLVIVAISDLVGADLDPERDMVMIMFNLLDMRAGSVPFEYMASDYITLHPVLAQSADPLTRNARQCHMGAFAVEPYTVGVFSIPQGRSYVSLGLASAD